MYSSPTKCFAWLLAGLLLLASPFALAANKESSLPPQYRQWLDRDVAYIITSQEKQDFLALTTDDARDKFIQQFWDIRNPSPGAPTNSYRDDIYARIAYANQHFGHDGWRTDMGRIYILFGPPQQHAIYRGQSNVRPMEIWFYSRPHPALPPFFSIVFYQRETGGDYRLYSPVMDGPDQLIAVTGAENNRAAAVQEIDRSLGREVARTTLSLLPDEPVDLAGATSSLSSDFMLATIRNLADSPANIQMLNERRRLLEAVTHRVVLGGEYLDVVTVPLLDRQGNTDLHYVLRLKRPEDFALQQSNDGRYYFSATVLARVSTPDKKLIFSQERKLNQYLTENQMEQVKNKVFGYEGVLPLPPGKYEIEFVLSNELKKTAFRDQKEVVVPAPPSSGFTLTSVVPFSDAAAQPDASDLQAFTAAGVKFTPLTGEGLNLVPGRDLQFFYQIWGPRADPKSYRDSKLSVEYAYGRMGMHDTKTLTDDVPMSQFNANGALINGKKIPTADLESGSYRLVITVTDPVSKERSFTSLNFHVSSAGQGNPSWDLSDPDIADEVREGVPETQRGLCYAALGDDAAAINWLARSYQKNHSNENVRAKLVELLFGKQQFGQVAQIYADSGVSPHTDDQTVVRMAESFDKLGQAPKSIQLLESAVALHPSPTLYLLLADYYQRAGNPGKASEMERKGKLNSSGTPQT